MLSYSTRPLAWSVFFLMTLFVCLTLWTWKRYPYKSLRMVSSLNPHKTQSVAIKSPDTNGPQSLTKPKFTPPYRSSNEKSAGPDPRWEIPTWGNNGFIKTANMSRQSLQDLLRRDLNMTVLLEVTRKDPECKKVFNNPTLYWRSPLPKNENDTFSEKRDAARMSKALFCGMLDWEYLTTPPLDELYPFEAFYLSRPPVVDELHATSEKHSTVTVISTSKTVNLSETIKLRIDAKDGRGTPKGYGGDEIRVWLVHEELKYTAIAAKVEDLGNGSYVASAPAPTVGSFSVRVTVTYSREYLRALIYIQLVLKSFRHVAALFQNKEASELTPCYHTRLLPGHTDSQFCDMTTSNGSPWFCGRPTKSQLDCDRDFAGSRVISEPQNIPATPAEGKLFRRASKAESKVFRLIPNDIRFSVYTDSTNKKYIQPSPACNEIPISDTWDFGTPTGFLYNNVWMPRHCHIPNWNKFSFYRDLEVVLLGDSNGRGHYYHFVRESKCSEIKRSLTEKWHKPLLCVHRGNNFTLRWEPHTQPFMNGILIAEKGSLIPSSTEIDKIPSQGRYLIILNHFFHITTAHISSIVVMFQSIKDALVRLVKRNPHVIAVLQGPHTSQVGWPNHHEAGDMLGHEIIRMQKEIFHEIQHRVVFLDVWDMTVAASNMDFHPKVGEQIFDTMLGFVNGRWGSH